MAGFQSPGSALQSLAYNELPCFRVGQGKTWKLRYRTTGIGKPYKLEFFNFSETLLLSINQHNTEISHSFTLTLRRSLVHTNLQFIHKFIEQNQELCIWGGGRC